MWHDARCENSPPHQVRMPLRCRARPLRPGSKTDQTLWMPCFDAFCFACFGAHFAAFCDALMLWCFGTARQRQARVAEAAATAMPGELSKKTKAKCTLPTNLQLASTLTELLAPAHRSFLRRKNHRAWNSNGSHMACTFPSLRTLPLAIPESLSTGFGIFWNCLARALTTACEIMVLLSRVNHFESCEQNVFQLILIVLVHLQDSKSRIHP